jgi:hypothetical protein
LRIGYCLQTQTPTCPIYCFRRAVIERRQCDLPSKVRALHTILASSIPESEVHCLISREGTSASLLDTMYANTEREIASRPDRLNSYTRMIFSRATGRGLVRTALLSLVVLQGVWAGWGGSDSEETESGLFGNSMSRDWLSSSSAISMQLEGCAWGYVSKSPSCVLAVWNRFRFGNLQQNLL